MPTEEQMPAERRQTAAADRGTRRDAANPARLRSEYGSLLVVSKLTGAAIATLVETDPALVSRCLKTARPPRYLLMGAALAGAPLAPGAKLAELFKLAGEDPLTASERTALAAWNGTTARAIESACAEGEGEGEGDEDALARRLLREMDDPSGATSDPEAVFAPLSAKGLWPVPWRRPAGGTAFWERLLREVPGAEESRFLRASARAELTLRLAEFGLRAAEGDPHQVGLVASTRIRLMERARVAGRAIRDLIATEQAIGAAAQGAADTFSRRLAEAAAGAPPSIATALSEVRERILRGVWQDIVANAVTDWVLASGPDEVPLDDGLLRQWALCALVARCAEVHPAARPLVHIMREIAGGSILQTASSTAWPHTIGPAWPLAPGTMSSAASLAIGAPILATRQSWNSYNLPDRGRATLTVPITSDQVAREVRSRGSLVFAFAEAEPTPEQRAVALIAADAAAELFGLTDIRAGRWLRSVTVETREDLGAVLDATVAAARAAGSPSRHVFAVVTARLMPGQSAEFAALPDELARSRASVIGESEVVYRIPTGVAGLSAYLAMCGELDDDAWDTRRAAIVGRGLVSVYPPVENPNFLTRGSEVARVSEFYVPWMTDAINGLDSPKTVLEEELVRVAGHTEDLNDLLALILHRDYPNAARRASALLSQLTSYCGFVANDLSRLSLLLRFYDRAAGAAAERRSLIPSDLNAHANELLALLAGERVEEATVHQTTCPQCATFADQARADRKLRGANLMLHLALLVTSLAGRNEEPTDRQAVTRELVDIQNACGALSSDTTLLDRLREGLRRAFLEVRPYDPPIRHELREILWEIGARGSADGPRRLDALSRLVIAAEGAYHARAEACDQVTGRGDTTTLDP